MRIGETISTKRWEIHRFSSSIRIREISGAGKRGAKCLELAIYSIPDTYSFSGRSSAENDKIDNAIDRALSPIEECAGYGRDAERMKMAVESVVSMLRRELDSRIALEITMRKGVEIALPKIEILTSNIQLSADGVHFSAEDMRDQNNRPTIISRTRGQARKAYDWVQDNRARAERMTFHDLWDAISKETRTELHYYCAMD